MRDIGFPEIALIVVAVVLIFGVGKLGQVGGALGKSIREFRRERDRKDEEPVPAATEARSDNAPAKSDAGSSKGKFCPNCGNKMLASAKFCMECGTKI